MGKKGKPPVRKKGQRWCKVSSRKKIQRVKKSDCARRTVISTGLQSSIANEEEDITKKSDIMEGVLTDSPRIVDDRGSSHKLVELTSNSFMESNELKYFESCKLDTGNSAVPHFCADTPCCSGPNPTLDCVHIESSVADDQAGFKSDLQGLDSSENSEMELLPCTVVEVVMKDVLPDKTADFSKTGLSESSKTLYNQTGPSVKIDENEESCSVLGEKSCHEMSLHGSLIQVAHSSNSVPLQENENLCFNISNMNAVCRENAECVPLLSSSVGNAYTPAEHNLQTEKCAETIPKKEIMKSVFGLNEEAGIFDLSANFDNSVAKSTSSCEAAHMLNKDYSSKELTECSRLELCQSETSRSVKSLPSLSVRKSKVKARSKHTGQPTSYRRRTRSSFAHSMADVSDKGVKKLTGSCMEEKTPSAQEMQNKSVQKNFGCVTEKTHQKTSSDRDPEICISNKQKSQMCHQAQSQCDGENSLDVKLVNECDFSDKSEIIVKAVSCRKNQNFGKLNKGKYINFVPEALPHCTSVPVKKGKNSRCKSYAAQNMCLQTEQDHNNEKINIGDYQKEGEFADAKGKLETVVQQKEEKIKELLQEKALAFKEVEELNNALILERKNSTVVKEAADGIIAALNEDILILRQNLHRSEQSLKDYQIEHSRILTEKDKYCKKKLENVIKESDMLRSHVGKLEYGRLLLQKELKLPSRHSGDCDFNVEVEAVESLRNELMQEKFDSEIMKNALKAEREKIVALNKNLESSKENIEHLKKKLEEMNTGESNKGTGDKSCCKREIEKVNKEVGFLKEYLSKIEKGKSLLRQELGLETAQFDLAEFGEEMKCISLIFEKLKAEEQNIEIVRNDLSKEKNKTQSLEQKLLQDVKKKVDLCDAIVQATDLKTTKPCSHIQDIAQLENALDYQLSVSKTYRETLASKEQEKRAFIDSLKDEYGDTVDDYDKFLSSLVWVSERSRKRLKKLENIISEQHQ